MQSFPPPLTEPASLRETLLDRGFAVLGAASLERWLGASRSLAELDSSWDRLEADRYLLDGGRYRFRRHACFVLNLDKDELLEVPPRPHFQPTEYNALHGGIERWFAPIEADVASSPAFRSLLWALGRLFSSCRAASSWSVEAHQFRIDTSEGIGRPTPEGAHRDGVDFVAVLLISRRSVKGGETRVFDARSPAGLRFTLEEPWSALLLDDERVIHESTPIQPTEPGGYRDTLVLTFRAAGFQQPGSRPSGALAGTP